METAEQVSVMMFRIKFVDGCDPPYVPYRSDGSYVIWGEELDRERNSIATS